MVVVLSDVLGELPRLWMIEVHDTTLRK